ncbi:MAG: ZIP family metal transporter [Clostridia bacterium]|nr:ZIP family metal transporter [Clostridia bacterium]
MNSQIISGVFIPLLGTAAGGAAVFFLKKNLSTFFTDILSALAAGIMTAASVWSLIIPAVERSENMGHFAFLPAVTGFILGNIFMLLLNDLSKILVRNSAQMQKLTTTVFAVTIHNFPEGMAVGTIYGAYLAGKEDVVLAEAFLLSVGIAVQNIPEGAIISMPLHAGGVSKFKAFLYGALSGAVEPLGAILTIFTLSTASALLPYLLSFAAGAMMFVVTEQLIPDIKDHGRVPVRALPFAVGFAVMMSLDVALS